MSEVTVRDCVENILKAIHAANGPDSVELIKHIHTAFVVFYRKGVSPDTFARDATLRCVEEPYVAGTVRGLDNGFREAQELIRRYREAHAICTELERSLRGDTEIRPVAASDDSLKLGV